MDSIFGIGGNELIVIVLLAAIVLGPERLARSAREIGKFVRNARHIFFALQRARLNSTCWMNYKK